MRSKKGDESCLTRVLKFMFCRCTMKVNNLENPDEDEEAAQKEDNSMT
jgi:hypothetical protein